MKPFEKNKRPAILLTVFIFIVLSIKTGESAERKNYTLYTSFEGVTSTGAIGAADWKEIGVLTVAKISEKTGFSIQPMLVPAWKDVAKKLKKGTADLAFIYSTIYLKLKADGVQLKPVITFTNGQKFKTCLYVNSKQKIKTLKDLKGKKLALSGSYLKRAGSFPSADPYEAYYNEEQIMDFLYLRQWLNKSGIKTLRDSGILFSIDFANTDSAVMALDKGLIAGAFANDFTIDMWKQMGQPLKNIKPLECTDSTYLIIWVASEKVPQSTVDAIRAAALDITKQPDPELRDIVKRRNMEAGKTGYTAFDDSDLKPISDTLREAERNGGRREAEEIVRELIVAAKDRK